MSGLRMPAADAAVLERRADIVRELQKICPAEGVVRRFVRLGPAVPGYRGQ